MYKVEKFNLLDSSIEINSDELSNYGVLKNDFNNICNKAIEALSKCYAEHKSEIFEVYAKKNYIYDYIYIALLEVLNTIEEGIKPYIAQLIENDFCEKDIDSYIHNNQALNLLAEITGKYHDMKHAMWDQMNDTIRYNDSIAYNNAYSQVTGNNFGIITNSVASALVYEIQNDYNVKKQSKQAYSQYESQLERIGAQAKEWFEKQWLAALSDYTQFIIDNLYITTNSLFVEFLLDFIDAGIFDDNIKDLSNNEKSNKILNNLELAENKKSILLKALEADPFNDEVYIKIVESGSLDEGVIIFANVCGMNNIIIDMLYSEVTNITKTDNYNSSELNKKIYYLSLAKGVDELEIKQELFKSKINNVNSCIKALKAAEEDIDHGLINDIFKQVVDFEGNISEKELNNYLDKKLNDFYELTDICGNDIILSIFKEYNIFDDTIDKYKRSLLKLFANKLVLKKKIVDQENVRLAELQKERERVKNLISEQESILNQNKYKFFGEGAKAKKEAAKEIESLNIEYNKIK